MILFHVLHFFLIFFCTALHYLFSSLQQLFTVQYNAMLWFFEADLCKTKTINKSIRTPECVCPPCAVSRSKKCGEGSSTFSWQLHIHCSASSASVDAPPHPPQPAAAWRSPSLAAFISPLLLVWQQVSFKLPPQLKVNQPLSDCSVTCHL